VELIQKHGAIDWTRLSQGVPINGLIEGLNWKYREGPDFDVWYASMGRSSSAVNLTCYRGNHPNIQMPPADLEVGTFSNIPVLWWKRIDIDYRTAWDAVIPIKNNNITTFIHFSIRGYDPKSIQSITKSLEGDIFQLSNP